MCYHCYLWLNSILRMNYTLVLILLILFDISLEGSSVRSNSKEHDFDFIIVGGGTSGCVLANRLTENGKYSVLVIEAGGSPPEQMSIPQNSVQNVNNPNLAFQYRSVPQQRVGLSLNRGVFQIPVGKVLGGTSEINHMVFNRGNPHDYNRWANYTGDPSWSYDNMLPYFKKSETYLGEFPSDQHGFHGPITVSTQLYAPGREMWLNGGRELGFEIRDPNGPQKIGFSPQEFSILRGRRTSSYKGYLEPILNRSNLRIETNSFATKLFFNGAGNSLRAVGILYNKNDTSLELDKIAFARREIILSAGTYGSSTLLMRSGIGPKKVLQSANIPQILELPVGQNYQNHPTLPFPIVINNKSLSFNPLTDLNPQTFQEYLQFGTGPYSTCFGYSGEAYLTSSVALGAGQSNWPDIQITFAAYTTLLPPFQNNFLEPWETTVQANLYVGREYSRGTVKLNPDDVNGMPIIDFNFYDDPRDVQVHLDVIQTMLKLIERTEVFKSLGTRLFKEPLDACAHLEFRSKKYWKCYIKQVSYPAQHPTGTCSMGAVVDSKLRVIGVKGLRVVDASIMPFITNSNLQAPTYGIAEKTAESILRDHSSKTSTCPNCN